MKTLNECKNEMMHEWFEVPRKDYKTWDEIMDLAAETYASQYKSEVERLKGAIRSFRQYPIPEYEIQKALQTEQK
jgi:hypothetical protein